MLSGSGVDTPLDVRRGMLEALGFAAAEDEAIRRSEALYRSLVEGSIQGVMIHVDGVIRLANQALAAMLGMERSDELIGQPVWQFIAPQDRDMAQAYAKARRDAAAALRDYG